ncbi:MAG: DUF480 domain-containing protein [Rubrivivax sp.]|nr:MAG: DUF480 domain-containing protein [Rubrivivax sp.]
MPLRPLSPLEARVLGTLMEKARTVPDSYPLTLNAVVSGCNQKTSREPLMTVTDTQAQEALDDLKALHLVFETSGGRVTRYEHNLQRALAIPEQSAALLGLLMLRGPQTAGELRINTERWHRFADISSVEAFLDELQERDDAKGGPLVVKLARAPGTREQRWAHLLCGPVADLMVADAPAPSAPSAHGANADATHDRALHVRLSVLENEVAQLRATVTKLCAELGLSQPGHEE